MEEENKTNQAVEHLIKAIREAKPIKAERKTFKERVKIIFHFIIKALFFLSILGFLYLILDDRQYGGGAVIFVFSIWGLFEYAKWVNKKSGEREEVKKLSNEEFVFMLGCLEYAYKIFCFNKRGHNQIDGQSWENFSVVWSNILVSWRNYYLVNFAKIFDKKSYGTKGNKKFTLSIFRIIPKSNFNPDSIETIKKIIQLRNEMLAHLESKKVLSKEPTEAAYGLAFEGTEIEALIGNTFELLNQVKRNYGFLHEINQAQQKDRAEKEFDRWYKIWKEKYN